MTGRGLILAAMEQAAKGACRLLRLIDPADLAPLPSGLPTALAEQANYLAHSLLADHRVILGGSAEELRELEESLWADNAEVWCRQLRDGFERLRVYMEELTFENFENGSVTAFYGRTQTNAAWLMEIYTRLIHRRAMVYAQLRQLDYSLDGRVFED